jgi:hypothetical protein
VILNIEFVRSLLHTLSLTHGVGDTRDLKVAELMALMGFGRLVLAFLGASIAVWWLLPVSGSGFCASASLQLHNRFLLCFF